MTGSTRTLGELIAAATPIDGGFTTEIPAGWMQGRTSYGGLSAALALEAAMRVEPNLPPLRSAQISFVGPLAGTVEVRASKLRRGRTAAFVRSDVSGAAGLGLSATFVFMAAQPSTLAHDARGRSDLSPPSADDTLYVGPTEFFTGNFEFRDRKDAATAPVELVRWARLRERGGLSPAVALMAIADALPPAALRLTGGAMAPVSSITWILNVLEPDAETTDGWWLLRAQSDFVSGGVSSQRMTIHAADGRLMAEGMQSVAIFV